MTWIPTTGETSQQDPPPKQVIIAETGYASASGGTGQESPVANDGFAGDNPNNGGTSQGTHYFIVDGSSGTISLKARSLQAQTSPYATPITHGSANAFVSFYVTVVNGSWDGPYYFHQGTYTVNGPNGSISTPWANNTGGTTPVSGDPYDGVSTFANQVTNNADAVVGSITPMWFWDGPWISGLIPPAPYIYVTSLAKASHDFDISGGSGINVDDGLGNSNVTGTLVSSLATDTQYVYATVESDAYMPGQEGYWAIGPTVHMQATVAAGITTQEGMFSEVSLTAGLGYDSP